LIVQYSLIIKQAHPRLAGDDLTFKSQWQAFRGNGKKAKTVLIIVTEKWRGKKSAPWLGGQ